MGTLLLRRLRSHAPTEAMSRVLKMRQAGARTNPTELDDKYDSSTLSGGKRRTGCGAQRGRKEEMRPRISADPPLKCAVFVVSAVAAKSPPVALRLLFGGSKGHAGLFCWEANVIWLWIQSQMSERVSGWSGKREEFCLLWKRERLKHHLPHRGGVCWNVEFARAAVASLPSLANRVDRWPALRKGPGRWDSPPDRGKVSG